MRLRAALVAATGVLATLAIASPSEPTLPVGDERPWDGYTGGIFGYASGVRGEAAACVLFGWVTDVDGGVGYWTSGINGEGVKGDFGGPFEFDGKLVGITSSMTPDPNPDRVGANVMVDIPTHRAWIKAVAGV